MRRLAVCVTMALTGALAGLAATGATGAAAEGTLCTPVVYSWSGNTTVAGGQLYRTGAQVPAQIGMQLSVEVFDVSTVDPAPGALALSVGDTPVVNGATISGGEIAVTNTGVQPVVLTRVEISVQQCLQVDVAPPVPGGVDTPAVDPPVLSVPSTPVELPATGQPSAALLVAAWSSTAAGAALLLARRRRPVTLLAPTACGRDR